MENYAALKSSYARHYPSESCFDPLTISPSRFLPSFPFEFKSSSSDWYVPYQIGTPRITNSATGEGGLG